METDQLCAALTGPIDLGGVSRGADLVGSEFEEDRRSAPVLDPNFRLIDNAVFPACQESTSAGLKKPRLGPQVGLCQYCSSVLSMRGLILDVGRIAVDESNSI